MQHCFTYGTLMCQEIMDEVCGASFDSCSASLKGFQRFAVRDEQYPGITESSPDQEVIGKLYLNLNEKALARLDSFEGDYYDRRLCSVETEDRQQLKAYVYVFRPQFEFLLTDSEWSFEDFLQKGKECFQGEYKGYNQLNRASH